MPAAIDQLPVPPYDYIQTFYIDPTAVNGAAVVNLTSVDLYIKTRPTATANRSGANNPGISIFICDTTPEGKPIYSTVYNGSTVNKTWQECVPSTSADVATNFKFKSKISLTPGKYYGIGIMFHDPAYSLWSSTQGDILIGTNTKSPGPSGKYDGLLFTRGNSSLIKEISSTDLKFAVYIAKYDLASNATITLVPQNYEFMTWTSYTGGISNGGFIGGELVYQETSNSSGTVLANTLSSNLIGTSTSFDSTALTNNYIVVTDGTNFDIRKVIDVLSTTLITLESPPSFSNSAASYKIAPVGKVYYTSIPDSKLYLTDSTANTSVKFAINKTVYGEQSNATANIASIDNYSVDIFKPEITLKVPPTYSSNVKYNFSYTNGGNYYVNNSLIETLRLNDINEIKKYDGYIMSRTNEITYPYYLYANTTTQKSGYIQINLSNLSTSLNSFESPVIDSEKIDIFGLKNGINNDYTNEDTNDGNALSKYISKKISFANNRFAEDLKVFLTAYKPAGTDIRVYAKIHNSKDNEAFDTKSWTYLEPDLGKGTYSSSVNANNYLDLSFGLPQFPPSNNTLSGYATTQSGNAVIATTDDLSSAVKAADLIKIYNPGVATNYTVKSVTSANSTAIIVDQPIEANNGVNGIGFKIDLLKPKNTAFNNILANNVARYYNNSMAEFDNFDTFSIKIVMLSNSTIIVPRINDLRAIGVSA